MNSSARHLAQKLAVQAILYYWMGDEKLAEQLISQSLTYTYPIGSLLTQLLN